MSNQMYVKINYDSVRKDLSLKNIDEYIVISEKTVLNNGLDTHNEHFLLINKKEFILDIKRYMMSKQSVKRNYMADMPRCTVMLDSVQIKSPDHVLSMFRKSKYNKYKLMLLCNASVMAKPYEILHKLYGDYDIYISDSGQPLEINMTGMNTNKLSIDYNKILKIIKVDGDLQELGEIHVSFNLQENNPFVMVKWKLLKN